MVTLACFAQKGTGVNYWHYKMITGPEYVIGSKRIKGHNLQLN